MSGQRKKLIDAELKAAILFEKIESRSLIVPGKSEKTLSDEVFDLAYELFGIKKYWHKRLVRVGKNTLHPYYINPPELVLGKDDICFFDFGPIFEEWEADYGRTYVLGDDPHKIQLKTDLEAAWLECKAYYDQQTSLTGAQLFAYAEGLAKKYGWEFGGEIAGHIIGQFPHEKLEKEVKDNYIHPDNHQDMFLPDKSGNKRDWILEMHFVDREKEIGGFMEQLLTI